MKKLFLFLIGLMLIVFMTSCGAKKETFVFEKDGYTITFNAPIGFFTKATKSEEYIRGSSMDQVAYVSEKFTMQIWLPGCSYTLDSWQSFKEMANDRPLFQEVDIEGTVGGSYRRYVLPSIQYTMMVELSEKCIDINFSPNDIKNLEWDEYMKNEDELIQKCIDLSTNEDLLAIMKSLKIKKT
jgi:hypothetical protein